jgi:hypothetical protein
MVSALVRRQQVAYVCQRGQSVRPACALLSVSRPTLGYEAKVALKDAPVLKAELQGFQCPESGLGDGLRVAGRAHYRLFEPTMWLEIPTRS